VSAALAVVTFAVGGASGAPQRTPAQARRLTVERITSQPSLIGTAPSSPTWSPDSSRLAFLWNDKATPFRDIWIVPASGEPPSQVTNMDRDFPYPEPNDPDPVRAPRLRFEARIRSGVSEFTWTPDGQALVFSYRGDLFRIDAAGGGLKRLTQAATGASNVAFSPDGRFISFVRSGDFWLLNQKTGHLVQATHVYVPPIGTVSGGRYYRPDVEIGPYTSGDGSRVYAWSPDSRYVALHYVDRRQVRKVPFPDYLGDETTVNVLRRAYPGDENEIRTIAIYSVGEGRFRLLDLPDQTGRLIDSFNWSPDARRLLIDQHADDAVNRWIYTVSADDWSLHEVWHDSGAKRTFSPVNAQWASDGQGVIFIGDLDDRLRLYSLPAGAMRPKALTEGDWDVVGERGAAKVVVSLRTKEIWFVSTQKNPYERQVYRMPEAGGAIVQVTSLPGTHVPFPSPDGTKLAVLHSNDVTPTELYVMDAKGGVVEQRVTQSPPKEFYAYNWVRPRYITFKSRIDNFTLHARILEPPNLDRAKKYPVIFGPVYMNTVRNQWDGLYSTLQQYLTLEGEYITVLVDVRGSVGYGRAFREKFLMDWGGGDLDDLQSAVEYLKTLPYVDAGRVGIWGNSYGGLLTVYSLLKKPGLFKAGVAGAPATDPLFFQPDDVSHSRRPAAYPEVYQDRAAVRFAENLQDHLMIIHGMQDDVVPFKTTVALAEQLMLLGKDFDFVPVPAANHEWSRRDYYATFTLRKLVEHFDRYLGRGGR
jgi:dipeptidyl-peptidase-4